MREIGLPDWRSGGPCAEHGCMLRRLHAVPAPKLHLWLMLVLTFTTGINDAVGYLGFDKVFTGNMTGNVVVLGMALAGGGGLPVLGPALALAGFMAGAAFAGRLLRRAEASWGPQTTILLAASALTMLLLALPAGSATTLGHMAMVTTVAAVVMGSQAATARHVGVRDVTTVVVTSTITSLAADSWFGTGTRDGGPRRVTTVALILSGAACGALVLRVDAAAGFLLAGAAIAGTAVVGALHAHRRLGVRPAGTRVWTPAPPA